MKSCAQAIWRCHVLSEILCSNRTNGRDQKNKLLRVRDLSLLTKMRLISNRCANGYYLVAVVFYSVSLLCFIVSL